MPSVLWTRYGLCAVYRFVLRTVLPLTGQAIFFAALENCARRSVVAPRLLVDKVCGRSELCANAAFMGDGLLCLIVR